MAVGDVVSDVGTSNMTFQPAAGVEIMLTWADGYATVSSFNLTDGTNNSRQQQPLSGTSASFPTFCSKIFLTNAHYLRMTGTGAFNWGYWGIQIK